MLKTIDPRNDGLLLFSDQVIPGAILLGYVNDDHWEVALPFEDNNSMLSKSYLKADQLPKRDFAARHNTFCDRRFEFILGVQIKDAERNSFTFF